MHVHVDILRGVKRSKCIQVKGHLHLVGMTKLCSLQAFQWIHVPYLITSHSSKILSRIHFTLSLQHWNEYNKSRSKMIQRRGSQVVLPFTFWDPADPDPQRPPKGIYEMRTYTLRVCLFCSCSCTRRCSVFRSAFDCTSRTVLLSWL